jgi:hypothetical protein
MQAYFPLFYRQFGIRRVQNLISPRLLTLTSLPRYSFLHFVSDDPEHLDVDPSKMYYTVPKRVVIDYQVQYVGETYGGPRPHAFLLRQEIRQFHRENRKFRFLPLHYEKIRDERTLLVQNYSYLRKAYNYPKMPTTIYNRWYNDHRVIFDKINLVEKTFHMNHFYMVEVTEDLPSKELLNIFLSKTTPALWRVFDTSSKLFILHLWRWIYGKDREHTIFGGLTKENYSAVNFVFIARDGRSTVLNLGYLNSWIKGEDNQTEFKNVTQIKPQQMQLVFLKFLMMLHSQEEVLVDDGQPVDPTQPASRDPLDVQEEQEMMDDAREYEGDIEEGDDVDRPDPHDSITLISKQKGSHARALELKSKLESEISSPQELDTEELEKQLSRIDAELNTLKVVSNKRLREKGIVLSDDGEQVNLDAPVDDIPVEVLTQKLHEYETPEVAFRRLLEIQVADGAYSAVDYKKHLGYHEAYMKSDDPYGSGQKTIEALVVKPEDIAINPVKSTIHASEHIVDKSMLQSSLLTFDSDYVTKVIKKDTLAMVNHLQKTGVVIKRHEIEEDHSALGSYENHTIELKPIDGQASTLRFRLPIVHENGTFVANGNKYIMRKQRVDLPIRKIDPLTVALTSYYGKTFVTLNPKKANSSLEWLMKKLNLAGLEEHEFIKRVAPANVFDNKFEAPFIYNAMAQYYKSIVTTEFTLVFDHTERSNVDPALIKQHERNGVRWVGMTSKKEHIWVNKNNEFYVVRGNEAIVIGDIFSLMKYDLAKAPVDFSEIRVFSKTIPLGVVLGYMVGFHNLIKILKARHRLVEGRQQLAMNRWEYPIRFDGLTYIFDRRDRAASQILGGFQEFQKLLSRHEVTDLDQKDVYLNLLEYKGLGSLYIRELEMTQQLFIDPATKDILEEMKMPVTFNGLLLKANDMLLSYNHPDSQSMDAQRIRGYERFPGAVYKEMVASIRQFRNRNYAGKSKIDMSPYEIWSTVMKDPAIKLVEDINPIQNLKETEIVTFVGEGGRSKESINKPSRAYHPSDMGVVSEATVDSSDVGINTYLSANPQFANLRGVPIADKKITPTNLVSTSMLLTPEASHDDPKRVGFISIQMGSLVPAMDYKQPLFRTGYESVIANRTSDTFATTAKQDGKVVEMTDDGVLVEYADGTRKGVNIGRIYGKAEGSVYPHDIVSPLKVGQKFKKGDPIAYNTGYFEPDFMDPTKIVMKNSMLVKTVLYESNQTHEDSSSVSRKLSERMTLHTTKIKSYTVSFNQNLIDVQKPGAELDPKTILMLIEDEITGGGQFDEESLRVLKRLSNQAPKSSYLGVLDKIEVFYHGDKVDMSASLKALADRSDREMASACRSSGRPVVNGAVNDEYRVSGVPLALDKAEIRFYITVRTPAGVGDKGSFGAQLKSVIGEVMDYKMHTEDGEEIDAIFGYRSVAARIVLSSTIQGTTNTLLLKASEGAVKAYRG